MIASNTTYRNSYMDTDYTRTDSTRFDNTILAYRGYSVSYAHPSSEDLPASFSSNPITIRGLEPCLIFLIELFSLAIVRIQLLHARIVHRLRHLLHNLVVKGEPHVEFLTIHRKPRRHITLRCMQAVYINKELLKPLALEWTIKSGVDHLIGRQISGSAVSRQGRMLVSKSVRRTCSLLCLP
ncbi:uncharacterized protein M421DRAFT_223988 [Didymella exigua CBS 183.55]|uniref:Uncharacterized protein n=1 Tax=Didymella exigua CBS 183.55 TaxID=1150837 RepID=A0A6A5RFH8_9PLEO|nr:uncharacterized protein M421DRAFT_223988 [Didymella exigua CBS 183.55]KAF1926050.1 hypothetical protein M421DRAFT_223988 [Didymella exigua CBS 183.55]